jgi:signal transduction histidine kinase
MTGRWIPPSATLAYGETDTGDQAGQGGEGATAATPAGRRAAPPGGETAIWGRWRLAWHAFFYLLLAYATATAIADSSLSTAGIAARLALASALGGWYAWWLIARPGTSRRDVVYLVGAVALWVPLIVLHPAFLWLGLGVLAPFCLHDLRHGAVVVLLVAGGWIWDLAQHGGVPWPAVAAVAVGAAGILLSVAYVGTIVRQSRERQRLLEQLQATRAELAAAERQAGMLAERQRLARDIHDTLSQGFASVVLLLEAATESLATGRPVDRHIAQALRSARDNLAESRRVVWALRPRPLAERSLPEALRELTGRLAEETGLRAEAMVTGSERPLGAAVEAALLRVAQEALANVRKHAAASQVTLTLSYLDDLVVLDVADDGVGFDAAATVAAAGGLGLRAMRERVEQLGGRLTIESAPGEGTTIAVELPAPARSYGHPAAPPGTEAR